MDVTRVDLRGSGRGAADAAPHFSVSQALMVERCPLQWRFKYVEQVPSKRTPEPGSNWAKGIALDDAITAACRGRSDEAYRLSREVTNAYVAFMKWHGDRFGSAPLPEAQTRVVTPVAVSPDDAVEFFGYTDLLYPSGLLVDIKFGQKPKPEKLVDWQRQLSSYALGLGAGVVTEARILRFGDSGLLDEYVIPLDVYDFEEWGARQVRRGPGSDVHAPTPGQACSWCDFTRQCAARCSEVFGVDG